MATMLTPIRSVSLLTRIIADAVADGLLKRSNADSPQPTEPEPMPDWQRELLAGCAAAQDAQHYLSNLAPATPSEPVREVSA